MDTVSAHTSIWKTVLLYSGHFTLWCLLSLFCSLGRWAWMAKRCTLAFTKSFFFFLNTSTNKSSLANYCLNDKGNYRKEPNRVLLCFHIWLLMKFCCWQSVLRSKIPQVTRHTLDRKRHQEMQTVLDIRINWKKKLAPFVLLWGWHKLFNDLRNIFFLWNAWFNIFDQVYQCNCTGSCYIVLWLIFFYFFFFAILVYK